VVHNPLRIPRICPVSCIGLFSECPCSHVAMRDKYGRWMSLRPLMSFKFDGPDSRLAL